MTKVKRGWDYVSEEKRKAAITEIIDFFKSERDEEIGVIAAEAILDFMLQTVGADIYNKGVEDTFRFVKERFDGMEFDIDTLIKK